MITTINEHYAEVAKLTEMADSAEGMRQANLIALARLHLEIAREAGDLQDVSDRLSGTTRAVYAQQVNMLLTGKRS